MADLARRSLLAGLAATPLAGRAARAASQPGATFDEILAGAKTEGKLVAWIAAPRMPETHRALIDAFNTRFGLKTRLEWVPNSAVTSNSRTMAEAPGGSVSVDVIGGGAIEEVAAATAGRIIRPYPWGTVFGKELPRVKALESMIMPDYAGFALPYQLVVYGLAWNPSRIPDDRVPAALTDLADPKWQGQFAFNSFYLVPLDVASYVMGSDATLAFAKKMIANQPVMEKGTPAVARSVSTGATAFGVTVAPVAELAERRHEPLKFKLFADVIPVSPVYVYVPDNSPNPNTARLFAAWLVAEGNKVGDPLEPMPAVGDPDAAINKMIAAQVAKTGAKVAQPQRPADLAASAKLREQLSLLVSGQSN